VNDVAYAQADEMAAAFGERLSSVLGDRLVGLYLVGSYVLRDLQAESDVDFIAVLSGDTPRIAMDELSSLLEWMKATFQSRSFEGFYVDEATLRASPAPASASAVNFNVGMFNPDARAGVVEWEMLRRHGHVVLGRPVPDLGIFDASAELPASSKRNLTEYWEPWLTRTGPLMMRGPSLGPLRKRKAWAAGWCVLGVPRLVVAIEDGEIVSKTEAGVRAKSRFDAKWRPLLDAAIDHRRDGSNATAKRLANMCGDALGFSRHVVDVALGR
jgi:hypothetical protein